MTRSATRAGSILALTGLLAVIALLSLCIGSNGMSPATAWHLLLNPDASFESVVVHEQRLPRTLLVIVVGCALGTAGLLIQSLTRNPLADPGLLGLNAGASLAVVAAVAVFGITSIWFYLWFAFAGAAAAGIAVALLGAVGERSASPARLALAGVAITMAISAVVQLVILTDQHTFNEFRFWAAGSAEGRGYPVLLAVTAFIVIGILIALTLAPALNALALGTDTAAGLGVPVRRVRFLTLATVTILSGAATAACGPIAFIGLVVPYAARALGGSDQRVVLPLAVLLGPSILLAADIVARVVAAPSAEVQLGIVAAIIGGPVFVALVRRRRIEAM